MIKKTVLKMRIWKKNSQKMYTYLDVFNDQPKLPKQTHNVKKLLHT